MTELSQPQAVVFDIGRVMVQWDLDRLYRERIADDDQRAWFIANVVSEEWHRQHDGGRDLAAMVAERKAQFSEFASLIDAYAENFLESIPDHVEGMVSILEELAASDVPLFALTNFADTFWSQFAGAHEWTRHFRDVVVSGREKLLKPDPAIYALAEERFGYSGAQLFFTDDTPENVAGARTAGWHAEVFHNAPTFRAQLVERGFLDA